MASDVASRVTTRRPLCRPQSARMNRHIDALQYSVALRQIAADQDASLKQAQRNRERSSEAARRSHEGRNEVKQMQAEAFRERQRQLREEKAAKYFAEDVRRTQELRWRKIEAYEDLVQAKSSDSYVRGCNAEIRKHQIIASERYIAALKQQRLDAAMSEAEQRRMQILESMRRQRQAVQQKRADHRESVLDATQQQKGDPYLNLITKEIQRTEGRMFQLEVDQKTWQVARRNDTVTQPELLIKEDLTNEATRLADLHAALKEHTTDQEAYNGPRRRPRSAMATGSRTTGIAAWSDGSRSVASTFHDARDQGPRVCVVDARISVA